MEERLVHRTCPLCEATCGLSITLAGDRVRSIRGDAEDVFSHGFLCPKGAALGALHEDPDRVRRPLRRTPAGTFEEVGWEEAFAEIDERLRGVLERHGRDAVATYLGNPSAHSLSALLYGRVFLRALGSRNVFSASTVDQFPKQLASALMFGTGATVPVPDVDRTELLVMLGANPLASNGSLMTAPDMRGRLRALRARGGRLVVFDPRRTRTALEADEYHAIRPGTDALALMAMVEVLFAEGLAAPHPLVDPDALAQVRELARPFTPEAVGERCGVAAADLRRLARELAGTERAAVYGRIGTCTQEFGTLASWLVDVVNILAGNLDRPGGAMFPRAAAGASNTRGRPGRGRGYRGGRWHSRVRGLGELFGELPVACLAEEIDTPGEGQVRALFTLAGNPAVSTPNAGRLRSALEQLELFVSLDIYVNETSRHADFILPAPSPLARGHYDLALLQFAVRNVARYTPPSLPPEGPDEWVLLLRLAAIAAGAGPGADIEALDRAVALELLSRELAAAPAGSPLAGREAAELLALTEPRVGPERLLDILLRTGPYGDGFGADPQGLSLGALERAPHGLDLGALEPRLPEVLRTRSGRIEIAPPELVADVPRLREALERGAAEGMVLVGRRGLRSNNSWMHNLPKLSGGPEACTAQVHPDDARRLGLIDGQPVRVSSRTGEIELPAEVTDAVMPGVVSIPHGWGHDEPGIGLRVARGRPGANSNLLADEELLDVPSGNAVLNGIPVTLRAAVPAPAVVA